jgi:hypothetical protein
MIILLSLVAMCTCSTNYTAANATVLWNRFIVRNIAYVPLNAPPLLPYQVIEDYGSNTIKGYFDYTNDNNFWVQMHQM